MNKELAKIDRVSFDYLERKCLSLNIFVTYENGMGQNICGKVLDGYCDSRKERVGSAYGCEMIRSFLETLSINELQDAVGKVVYVIGSGTGLSFKPEGIRTLSLYGKPKEMVYEDIFNYMGVEHD